MATGSINKFADKILDARFPEQAIASLNNPPTESPMLVITDSNTSDTPYKAGLTGNTSSGLALIVGGNYNFAIQIYFVKGKAEKVYIRSKAGGTWTGWRSISST